jgi:Heme NO binding associated
MKSRDAELEALDNLDSNTLKPQITFDDLDAQNAPEFSRDEGQGAPKDRRNSQSSKNILLKGEMRYLKDVNMLIFLCSPL